MEHTHTKTAKLKKKNTFSCLETGKNDIGFLSIIATFIDIFESKIHQ